MQFEGIRSILCLFTPLHRHTRNMFHVCFYRNTIIHFKQWRHTCMNSPQNMLKCIWPWLWIRSPSKVVDECKFPCKNNKTIPGSPKGSRRCLSGEPNFGWLMVIKRNREPTDGALVRPFWAFFVHIPRSLQTWVCLKRRGPPITKKTKRRKQLSMFLVVSLSKKASCNKGGLEKHYAHFIPRRLFCVSSFCYWVPHLGWLRVFKGNLRVFKGNQWEPNKFWPHFDRAPYDPKKHQPGNDVDPLSEFVAFLWSLEIR